MPWGPRRGRGAGLNESLCGWAGGHAEFHAQKMLLSGLSPVEGTGKGRAGPSPSPPGESCQKTRYSHVSNEIPRTTFCGIQRALWGGEKHQSAWGSLARSRLQKAGWVAAGSRSAAARLPGFKSRLCHFPAVRPQVNHFCAPVSTSLNGGNEGTYLGGMSRD